MGVKFAKISDGVTKCRAHFARFRSKCVINRKGHELIGFTVSGHAKFHDLGLELLRYLSIICGFIKKDTMCIYLSILD